LYYHFNKAFESEIEESGVDMPIYEFECEKCRHQFERLVFAGDNDTPECPKCGCRKTSKLMSACSIRSGGALSGLGDSRASSCAPKG
jgi:putative FmdB family regulatory protein